MYGVGWSNAVGAEKAMGKLLTGRELGHIFRKGQQARVITVWAR